MISEKIIQASTNKNIEKHLYRRQFILGPRFVERFESWKRTKIDNSLFITHHPELPLIQKESGSKTLTLLGYILDPYQPQLSDLDILTNVVEKVNQIDDIFELTDHLAGRWILIVKVGEEVRLFHDATGTRQVVYTDSLSGIWCASQSGLIADYFGFNIDKDIQKNFIESVSYQSNKEYWFPNDSTPFKEIKLLIPNHYLDLKKGGVTRYWPNQKITSLSLKEGVKESAKLLSGVMESAANRFDLALSVTCGLDSRMLIAASRKISKKLYFYTLIYNKSFKKDPDVRIPAQLLPKLALKHHCILCPASMSDEFKAVYQQNVVEAHPYWGRIAEGIYNHFPETKVTIKGNAGEVGRLYYRLKDSNSVIDGKLLADLTNMATSPYAVEQFEYWLSQASNPALKNNIHILDLFYWEQRMGQWQAMSQLEWDIVQEVVTPFNCRKLLTTILSVDEEYRKKPTNVFQIEVIKLLWPETLQQPINPWPAGKKLKFYIKNKLKDFGIYGPVKKVKDFVYMRIKP